MGIPIGIAAVVWAILRGQGADDITQLLGTAGFYLISEGIRRLPPGPPPHPGEW